jgi:hypothetical protein
MRHRGQTSSARSSGRGRSSTKLIQLAAADQFHHDKRLVALFAHLKDLNT